MSPTKRKNTKKKASQRTTKKSAAKAKKTKKSTKTKKATTAKKASSKTTSGKKTSKKKTVSRKKRGGLVPRSDKPVVPKQMQKDVYGVYEKAVGLLRQEKVEQAQKQLMKILAQYPGETEVLAKVRSFLKICEKKLTKKEARSPRSAETLFSQGVFHHNAGEFQKALESYSQAMELSGKEKDHIYYAMAASEYSLGDTDAALRDLKKAISGNPDNRYYAQNDPDFRELGTHKKFQALVQPE